MARVTVTEAWSSAAVTANGAAGGAFGSFGNGLDDQPDIRHGTRDLHCSQLLCSGRAGGGRRTDVLITRSFATGPVTGGVNANVGGLLGQSFAGSQVEQTYATGPVSGGASANVGSLVGMQTDGILAESYGVGAVVGGAGANRGRPDRCRSTVHRRLPLPIGIR